MENEVKRNPEILIKTKGVLETEVYVEGRKLEGVTGIKFIQNREMHGVPRLQIDLRATNVTLDTKAIPELPYPFSEFYELKNNQ